VPGHEGCSSLAVHWSPVGVVGTVEDAVGGGLLEGVVVVAGAVVDGEMVFGCVVPTEEPHPRATIPAAEIRAATPSRLIVNMMTSRPGRRSHRNPSRRVVISTRRVVPD